MISSVKQTIINKLSEMYPRHTIYDEDIPQNFETPSFYITLIDQDYSKRLNTKFKSSLSFDVAYFSDKEVTEVKEDCLIVQQALLRGFDIIDTYRVINKQVTTVDNVLHFTFGINYSEMIVETQIPMQTQTMNTNM